LIQFVFTLNTFSVHNKGNYLDAIKKILVICSATHKCTVGTMHRDREILVFYLTELLAR